MKKIADMVCEMEEEKKNHDFFDINCWLPFGDKEVRKNISHLVETPLRKGNFSTAEKLPFESGRYNEALLPINTMEELVGKLSSFGIKRAVVSNERCFTCSPEVGNDEVISQVSHYKNLFAGAVLAPEISFPPNELHKYINRLLENKVVMVRLFPKKLNHSLKKWQMGDIFSYLEYKKLPLMMWHTEADWDVISEICREYPGLNVIIEGNDKKLLYHNRDYLRLLRNHQNLYIETHNIVQYLGLEYISNQLSIDRLIFGTYFPFNDPNSAMYPIISAEMDHTVKEKVTCGNLDNLINKILRYD